MKNGSMLFMVAAMLAICMVVMIAVPAPMVGASTLDDTIGSTLNVAPSVAPEVRGPDAVLVLSNDGMNDLCGKNDDSTMAILSFDGAQRFYGRGCRGHTPISGGSRPLVSTLTVL